MSCDDALGGDAQGLPPEVIPYLADRVSATRAAKGSTVHVSLDGIPEKVAGREAYVAGFAIRGLADWTTVASSMTGSYSGYQALGQYSNIILRDRGGFPYLEGVDGRDLYDDVRFRSGNPLEDTPATLPDADATPEEDLDLTYVWADFAHGKLNKDGLIRLRDLRGGQSGFQFTLRSDVTGGDAGVTFDGITSAGLRVYVFLVYLSHEVGGAKWQLRAFTNDELSMTLPHPERLTEYAAIRPLPEDPNGTSVNDYDGITVNVGGFTIASALAAEEMAEKSFMYQQLDQDWYTRQAHGPIDLDTDPEVLFLVDPAQNKGAMAHGRVGVQINTRQTNTTNRILHRTWKAMRTRGVPMVRNAQTRPSRRLASFLPQALRQA